MSNLVEVLTHRQAYIVEAADIASRDGLVVFFDEDESVTLAIPADSIIHILPTKEAEVGKTNG